MTPDLHTKPNNSVVNLKCPGIIWNGWDIRFIATLYDLAKRGRGRYSPEREAKRLNISRSLERLENIVQFVGEFDGIRFVNQININRCTSQAAQAFIQLTQDFVPSQPALLDW